FEYPTNNSIRKVPTTGVDEKVPSILTYFMDGSRRVFRFSDIILGDGRYYPVLAGQVGVAVLKRTADGSTMPLRKYVRYDNVLVLPDTIDKADQKTIHDAMSKHTRLQFSVKDYETGASGGTGSDDYINKGTKKILDLMHDIELDAVRNMMGNRDLRDDAMLVVDGSLQFRRDVLKRNNFPISQLANVVGISKSFTPSQPVTGMKSGKHLGAILQDLEFGQRTPVFKVGEDAFADVLGVWYLRIRPRQKMTNPLAGIIKIEVLASGSERDDGLDQARVDNLSALTRLHQLNAIFAIFGASDRDKSLDLKGRGLRNRLWCRPSSLRGRGRGASLRHVFALQDSPQGRQGTSRMVGCRKPAR